GVQRKVWDMLPDPVTEAIEDQATGIDSQLTLESKRRVVESLNSLLKVPEWSTHKDFAGVVKQAGLKPPPKGIQWESFQQVCAFTPASSSTLFPEANLPPLPRIDAPRVLAYRSENSAIGEMGLLNHEPRMATCLAYDHPSGKFGEVETLQISKDLFEKMLE